MEWQVVTRNFVQTADKFRALYNECLSQAVEDSGLPRIELEILLFLHHHPDMNTACEICRQKFFAKSHVSKALKNLEAAGLISRSVDSSNLKLHNLKLEEKADPYIEMGLAGQKEFASKVTSALNDQQLAQLEFLLSAICRSI